LVVYSSDSNEFLGTVTGQLEGNIFNSSGQIVYNFETKEFNLDTVKIVDSLLRLDYENNLLSIGKSPSSVPYNGGSVVIYSNQDILDDYGPLSVYTSKNSVEPGAITLVKTRGTIDEPLPVQPGDKLNGILFAAQSGATQDTITPVGLIEVAVAENSVVAPNQIEGQFNLLLSKGNGNINNVLSVNADGHTKTIIKDLSVVGETNNSPTNSSTPSKWLEINVNGETVFLPLYS
jgi:hypothetical protein